MEILRNFEMNLDKEHILEVVETYLPSCGEDRGKIYDSLVDMLYNSTEAVGFLSYLRNQKSMILNPLRNAVKYPPVL
ncbi:hypothetical protein PL321_00345 [Caloramator sp. mosi_1]|uniref:hypothetical protein n=1 Tax=Caloramator sp. mosi_1 TaxID=3023090 RepID=UPI00236137A7|nr:hypothetical protein [Caloramator sp. mosi_1]WDC84337.1 hypothetical protein PL321_00345 [Caloramator sp. mosi_1]